MHISSNTTGMQAGLSVAMDKDAREHCVVVIKGTFRCDDGDEPRLAETQRPLVFADEHHGDPGATSIRYECDFALGKPRAEVLVHGHAIARRGRPVESMLVRLELPERSKELLVTGDRYWDQGLLGLSSTQPKPFNRMPMVFEHAFGGSDYSHPEARHQGTELRNPVGVGFCKNPSASDALGVLLPNIEDPRQRIERWRDTPTPVGFGSIGRNWQPRIGYAGTYDERWLHDVCPFLPADFEPRYFQSAPEDQQVPELKGGQVLRCIGMTETGTWTVTLPCMQVPVSFHFRDRRLEVESRLDTVLLDCDAQEAVVIWRASCPLGKKLINLREVRVGAPPPSSSFGPVSYRKGKPYFQGLGAFVAWTRRKQRGGSP
ncbi:DUF2169 domain-containing protein [Cystobacter fuscus]|uniref:DUF2169 family type VI secretion system accessory protein n=1 Tax=Cystobacter fuscus TaxID=43 RepID=UPI002B2EC0FE|nr:DUF2169 domain-containing protein [Cystobacter fuscus]